MSSRWTVTQQKELVNTVGLLETLLVVAYFSVPVDSTYPLLKFQMPLHGFFLLMATCWGAFLFWMMVARLPIGERHQAFFRDNALLWLTVLPAVYGLFILLVAVDVTYPIVDSLIIPAFLLGVFGLVVWYLKVVESRLFDGLRWVSRKGLKLVTRLRRDLVENHETIKSVERFTQEDNRRRADR